MTYTAKVVKSVTCTKVGGNFVYSCIIEIDESTNKPLGAIDETFYHILKDALLHGKTVTIITSGDPEVVDSVTVNK